MPIMKMYTDAIRNMHGKSRLLILNFVPMNNEMQAISSTDDAMMNMMAVVRLIRYLDVRYT